MSSFLSVWVFSTAFWQESVVFAGLCNLREIHFSREGLKFFEIHKPANTTLSCQKAIKKTQNRQEGRHKTDFCETSLHKRNERPYTKRN